MDNAPPPPPPTWLHLTYFDKYFSEYLGNKYSSELPPPAIKVSFELLGPECHVTPQHLRNGHVIGGW